MLHAAIVVTLMSHASVQAKGHETPVDLGGSLESGQAWGGSSERDANHTKDWGTVPTPAPETATSREGTFRFSAAQLKTAMLGESETPAEFKCASNKCTGHFNIQHSKLRKILGESTTNGTAIYTTGLYSCSGTTCTGSFTMGPALASKMRMIEVLGESNSARSSMNSLPVDQDMSAAEEDLFARYETIN